MLSSCTMWAQFLAFISTQSYIFQEFLNSLVLNFLPFILSLQLLGIGVLGFSIYCYLEPQTQEIINSSGYPGLVQNLIYALICVGALTMIVALFGCCGAYHESTCLIGTYVICVTIILGVEVAIGVLGFMYRSEVCTISKNSHINFLDRPSYW